MNSEFIGCFLARPITFKPKFYVWEVRLLEWGQWVIWATDEDRRVVILPGELIRT